MSNHAWVCFTCHSSVRRPGIDEDVRCPSCGKACEHLGYKTPIPPKSKLKEWEALRLSFYERRRQYLLDREGKQVRLVHELEQEIQRLKSMPENDGRVHAVKQLERRLSDVRVQRVY
jgi:DNA-directed RNA polymerase subunit RPC12/RpoP